MKIMHKILLEKSITIVPKETREFGKKKVAIGVSFSKKVQLTG